MCIVAVSSTQQEETPPSGSRRPVYPISVAAELAGVHPRTLYMYEKQQLLIPARRGTWRFYSEDDLAWIRVIRFLLHEGGINIAGLQRILALNDHHMKENEILSKVTSGGLFRLSRKGDKIYLFWPSV